MAVVEINDLHKIGVVKDRASFMLPPNAFTDLMNVRTVDECIQRMLGWEQIFGTPGIAPHFALPLSTASQTFWIYVSLDKAHVLEGVTDTNITRQVALADVDYNAVNTRDWNATIIGGIPILNNGADVPQFWPSPISSQKLEDLTNWPSTLRAAVLRALGPHLIAINIVDDGDSFPHLVRWSHAVSDPGTVPSSWDYTDPTVDAGVYDLPDVNSGILLEALNLQNKLFLYKEGSVWAMRYVGGRFVFNFETFLETVGILAPRCVAVTGDGLRHVFATQDDLVVHNGNTVESILDKRMRKSVFNDIDPSNYLNSFVFNNSYYSEMWFCYPQAGEEHPNKAVIWNYRDGSVYEADGITFRNVALGSVEAEDTETWDDGTDTWEDDTGPWNEVQRRKLVGSSPINSKFYAIDKSITRDGVAFAANAQRVSQSIIGKKSDGTPIVDHQIMKVLQNVWPKVRGGPIRIRVGFQDKVDGPITWMPYATFDPTTQDYANFIGTGRAIGIEFNTLTAVDWKLDGYKLELEKGGIY